jgi:hypothetical protein
MAEAMKHDIAQASGCKSYRERMREWRQTRDQLISVVEDMIAEAHGKKEKESQNDSSDSGEGKPNSLRDKLKELSELSLREPLPYETDLIR